MLLNFPVSTLYSQLKHESSWDGIVRTIELDNGEVKFYHFSNINSTLSIYNFDNSIWKTIKLPLTKSHRLDEIKLISMSIFNKDTLAEVLYTCTSNSISGFAEELVETTSYTLNLIDETGKVLFKEPDCNNLKFVDSKGTKKLLIYKNSGVGIKAKVHTVVYALP